jgi:glycosyltransferase involved in cell wall biosynthesis
MSRYRVVVVIPTFNAESYVGKAIDSAIAQDYPNVRCVVVDDCSTDGTWREIQKYKGRVDLLRNSASLGFAGVLNRALEFADEGDLCFIHQDDVVLKQRNYISLAARYFDDPSVALVSGQPEGFDRLPLFKRLITRLLNNDRIDDRITEVPYSLLKADLIRVSALRSVGGFECAITRLLGLEDHLLGRRLRDAGYRLLKDPSITYTLDYARSESLGPFLGKEIRIGLNLGYAVAGGLIDPVPYQDGTSRVKRNFRLGQVVFCCMLALGSALGILFGPQEGEVVLSSIFSLRVVMHLFHSKGFAAIERPMYVCVALAHDIGFSCGWLIGFLLGVFARMRGRRRRGHSDCTKIDVVPESNE